MKMAWFMCLLLLLTGCSAAPAWETVEDFVPAVPVSSWLEDAYAIQIGLPEQAELTWEGDGCKLYEAGDLEIETSTFLASSLNSAVKRLSGYEAERVSVLKTKRFDLPEYQFAWYCQTEEGGRLCRADLVMDGTACYAVVCSAPENAGDSLGEETRQVFSSFGLSDSEMV